MSKASPLFEYDHDPNKHGQPEGHQSLTKEVSYKRNQELSTVISLPAQTLSL
ncbi:hypothetical protein N8137_01945 [Porticoccaceae bacterium]|nr:hypothetical protein [Porticoccaceae bacterium]